MKPILRIFDCRGLSVVALCGLALPISSCGGGSSNPDAASSYDVAAPDGALGQEAAGPGQPYCTSKPALAGVSDLSGTWVARIAGAEVVNAPIVGVMHNQTVLYLLFVIDQQGTVLSADGRYCDRIQVNPPGALVPVVIPDAWAHTETPVHRTGSFAVGPEGFAVMTFEQMSEGIGWVLGSPTDTLPSAATDPRVIDQDGDGQPGITIALTGQALAGSLYTVQLQTTSVRGIAVAADRVEGALSFMSDQNVLASNPETLAVLYSQGSSGADPVVCNSSFAMVKVAEAESLDGGAGDGGSGSLGCDWVRANETALFP